MHLLIDLQACQTPSSRNRGIGRYSLAFTQALAQAAGAHRLSLLLSDRFPDSLADLRETFAPLVGAENIHVVALPPNCYQLDTANATRWRMAELIREQAIRQIGPDIVHLSSLFEGLCDDAVAAVDPGSPHHSSVTLYDLIPYLNAEHYLTDAAVRRWYYRKLQSLKHADRLLAISESSRREAIDALGCAADRVCNISSAIDARFRPLDLPPAERAALGQRHAITRPFVLYTGGIDYRKNVAGLIRGYAALPADLRGRHQLVIVCDIQPDARQELNALARRQGLGRDELILTGYVSDDELVRLYNLAKLFVFPSLHEGFGLPVLEAMACGAPALGADRSSIPEVIGWADALFDPTRESAITAAIDRALRADDFRRQLREHGLKQARQFSWRATARRALDVLETLGAPRRAPISSDPPAGWTRPRLAFFSPLPGERSGIADYSAGLIPELARYYDIELITDSDSLSDDWLQANHPVRGVAWFRQHADRYDRILYHFGNSAFHLHMFPLLRGHPGVVVLHDYYLSGVLRHGELLGYEPHVFHRSLFRAHGYRALLDLAAQTEADVQMAYPANRAVLDFALGVLVHSRHSIALATRDYGAAYARRLTHVPFARAAGAPPDRAAARARLGIAPEDFLVCSFGFLAYTKCNVELLQAWRASTLAARPRARLVFVGERPGGDYAVAIDRALRDTAIAITGFVSGADYALWLAAADIGVQLRAHSRGETSAALFDCFAHRLPLVFNAHGSAAELPDTVGIKLPDAFAIPELAAALERLFEDPVRRDQLGRQGHAYLLAHHRPRQAARRYHAAIEAIYREAPLAQEMRLIAALADLEVDAGPSAEDRSRIAACIAGNRLEMSPPRLLIDITGSAPETLKPWLTDLARRLPPPWRFDCVEYAQGWRTARATTCALLDLPARIADPLWEEPLLVCHQDAWLALAASPPGTPQPGFHAQRAARLPDVGAPAAESVVTSLIAWLEAPATCPPPLQPFIAVRA